jgi:DNA-binding MarR family transcriptional regulator
MLTGRYKMARTDILERVALDLLSIPPLIFRGARRKLIKTTLSDMKVGITPHHFEIIHLLDEEGTLHIAEIGENLQIAKAQMTQLIDKLEDLDLINKEIDTADRRIINITLSDYGKTILKEHKNSLMIAVRDSMSHLTDEDLEGLSDSLRKLREILYKMH